MKALLFTLMIIVCKSSSGFSQTSFRLDQFSRDNPSVSVPDTLLFVDRKSTLTPYGADLLKQLQGFVKEHPSYHIAISKSRAKKSNTRKLNIKKMEAIKKFLATDTATFRHHNLMFLNGIPPKEGQQRDNEACTEFGIIMIKDKDK